MAKRKLPYVVSRKRRDGSLAYRGFADGAGTRLFSETYDTERDAYDAALRMRGEAKNQAPGETLDDAIEAVKADLRVKRTSGTLRWYSDHLRAVCLLIPGDIPLHSITRETIEQFVRDRLQVVDGERRVKPATVNADLRALHRVFAVAIRRGVVRENPVRQVDRPRADAPAFDWFTDAEFRAVVAKVPDQRARDVMLLVGLTGIRRSELARLQPGHVRLNLRQLVVPGKNATRVVPLSADIDASLKRLLASANAHLIQGGTHAIDDLFREARKAVGDRRLHAHALRHTFGTALVRSGVRLDVVMRLMGHRDIKTTVISATGGLRQRAQRRRHPTARESAAAGPVRPRRSGRGTDVRRATCAAARVGKMLRPPAAGSSAAGSSEGRAGARRGTACGFRRRPRAHCVDVVPVLRTGPAHG